MSNKNKRKDFRFSTVEAFAETAENILKAPSKRGAKWATNRAHSKRYSSSEKAEYQNYRQARIARKKRKERLATMEE